MILGGLQAETFSGQRFEVALTVGPHGSGVITVFNPAPESFLCFFSMAVRLPAFAVNEADIGGAIRSRSARSTTEALMSERMLSITQVGQGAPSR